MSNNKSDMIAKAQANIRYSDWMVEFVPPDVEAGIQSFGYTVGLSDEFEHPEIFMAGFSQASTIQLLSHVAKLVEAGMRFESSVFCDGVIQDFPVAFVPADDASVYQHSTAGRFYLQRSFKGVQMFIPDLVGKFPWDEGCEARCVSYQDLLALEAQPPKPGDRPPNLN